MNEPTKASNIKPLVLWLLRISVALVFLIAAWMKLSGNPRMIEEFDMLGMGQWFRHATAIIEGLGAIALLIPGLSPLAALLLLCVDAGAFLSQVIVLHHNWILPIVLAIGLLAILSLQARQLRQLWPFTR